MKFHLFLDTGFVVEADTEEAAINEARRQLRLALDNPEVVLDWTPEIDDYEPVEQSPVSLADMYKKG